MNENDLIRRSELLANFDGIYDCCDLVFEPNDKCCKAEDCSHCKFYPIKKALRKLVEHAPAADAVEVVHAEWVKRPTSGRFPTFECSSCHGYTGGEAFVKTCHYCPNCGARMDGQRREDGDT